MEEEIVEFIIKISNLPYEDSEDLIGSVSLDKLTFESICAAGVEIKEEEVSEEQKTPIIETMEAVEEEEESAEIPEPPPKPKRGRPGRKRRTQDDNDVYQPAFEEEGRGLRRRSSRFRGRRMIGDNDESESEMFEMSHPVVPTYKAVSTNKEQAYFEEQAELIKRQLPYYSVSPFIPVSSMPPDKLRVYDVLQCQKYNTLKFYPAAAICIHRNHVRRMAEEKDEEQLKSTTIHSISKPFPKQPTQKDGSLEQTDINTYNKDTDDWITLCSEAEKRITLSKPWFSMRTVDIEKESVGVAATNGKPDLYLELRNFMIICYYIQSMRHYQRFLGLGDTFSSLPSSFFAELPLPPSLSFTAIRRAVRVCAGVCLSVWRVCVSLGYINSWSAHTLPLSSQTPEISLASTQSSLPLTVQYSRTDVKIEPTSVTNKTEKDEEEEEKAEGKDKVEDNIDIVVKNKPAEVIITEQSNQPGNEDKEEDYDAIDESDSSFPAFLCHGCHEEIHGKSRWCCYVLRSCDLCPTCFSSLLSFEKQQKDQPNATSPNHHDVKLEQGAPDTGFTSIAGMAVQSPGVVNHHPLPAPPTVGSGSLMPLQQQGSGGS
ncbi:hypothetical protein ADUPG1_008766, partial [Aduncisulcus paluster]